LRGGGPNNPGGDDGSSRYKVGRRELNYKVITFIGAVVAAGDVFAQPINDACPGALDLTGQTFPLRTPPISLLDASTEAEVPAGCAPFGHTVWYKFVPAAAGDVVVSTCAADAPGTTLTDTVVVLYRSSGASCGVLTPIACSDDACGLRSRLAATVVAGTTYFIQVGAYVDSPPAPGRDLVSLELTAPFPLPSDRWVEQGDAGELIDTAQNPEGDGALGSIGGHLEAGGADLYSIDICDASIFSAAVAGGPFFDSQLFLFDAEGHGVVMNDDHDGSLLSRLTGALLPGPGVYYLGISEFDRDPVNEDGLEIWADGPSAEERSPDGPGGDGMLAGWTIGGFTGHAYVIELTGACFPVIGTCWGRCPADYDRNGGIDGADVEAFFTDWEVGESCADANRDGSVDGADLESFFISWERGGC